MIGYCYDCKREVNWWRKTKDPLKKEYYWECQNCYRKMHYTAHRIELRRGRVPR